MAASLSDVTMTDYTPIDCGLHSEYELAIMQQRKLRVSWTDPGGQAHVETLRPLDLITRQHEEFMVAETANQQRIELRLDYIIRAETA